MEQQDRIADAVPLPADTFAAARKDIDVVVMAWRREWIDDAAVVGEISLLADFPARHYFVLV
jgi:hypothetical protein